MSLVTGLDILSVALKGKYGVGAFNTNNMEITQAILEASEEANSPVILSLSEGAIKYGGSSLIDMVIHEAKQSTVPVAVHLDHGSSYESCMQCIRAGFTSVMIDKSHENEEVNTREVKRVVEAAHVVGVSVEAEIGRLGGIEEHIIVSEDEATLTEPEEAKRFMDNTGADFLAVAIGTSHGANKGKGRPFIHHERIIEISNVVSGPLVMHGASGVPQDIVARLIASGGKLEGAVGIHEDDVRKAVTEGIAKINTDTDLRLTFTAVVREILQNTPEQFDPRKILGPARDEMKRIVAERIDVFGSTNKA